jgi:hypothetical protein
MRNNFSKKLGLSIATFGMVAASMLTGQDAEAMPGFARQTGMPCNACHFQTFPALGSMGRGFKAGGYTMEGSQASIEGENQLKLPDTLNLGGVIKIRHNKTNGDYKTTDSATDYGRIDFPDEAAFLAGGRLSANAGYLWEFSVKEHAGLLGAKYVFNAAKVGDIQFQVIPYMTDGQGAGYGGEQMNTAALGLQRYAESKAASAPHNLGINDTATGINLVAQASNWAVNFNQFAPAWTGSADNGGEMAGNITGLATYLRVNYFMDIAGFDTGIGFGTMSGTAKTMSGGSEIYFAPQLTFFDVQLQGQLAGMDTGIYISSGTAAKAGTAADTTYVYGDGAADKSATGVAAKVGITPELFVTVQSGSVTDGTTANTSTGMTSIGLQYMIAQNIKYEISSNTDSPSGGTASTNLQMMLFIGM